MILSFLMRLRGKKVGLIGLGIGTENFKSQLNLFLFSIWFRLCNVAVFRQEIDRQVPGWVLVPRKNIISADLMLSQNSLPRLQTETKHQVAISLASEFKNREESRQDFIAEIVPVIKHVIEQNYEVHLISFMNEEDQSLNDDVAAKMNHPKCKCIQYSEQTIHACTEFAEAEYALCMRFHASVLALNYGTPFFAIKYGDKTDDLVHRTGLDAYSCRYRLNDSQAGNAFTNIKHSVLIEGFDRLRKYREQVRAGMRKGRLELAMLSDKNLDGLRDLLL
ncbi:MAG: polysaccharide pyruvyl transferase family protein [Intestinibacillus sp.]